MEENKLHSQWFQLYGYSRNIIIINNMMVLG